MVRSEENRFPLPQFKTKSKDNAQNSVSTVRTGATEHDPDPLWKQWLQSFLQSFTWIPAHFSWTNIKPAIRASVTAWVSLVLFLIPAGERLMGQASFLILMASFISPPLEPFIAVFEREFLILLFAATAWAWACLGIFLANLARTHQDPTVTLLQAISGQYLEVAPTLIIGVFIFLGSAFFLYIKARQGPGPYLFAVMFACICLNISLTTAVLFPFPFYRSGRGIMLPLAFHSALALLASVLIFPSSISAQYTVRLQAVLTPFEKSIALHRELLRTPTTELSSFTKIAASITTSVAQAEGALVPLAASARLLGNDIIYARFAPEDFRSFQAMIRRIMGRANGMRMFFSLIDPTRERFPVTPGPSVPHTPTMSMTPETGNATPVGGSRDPSPSRKSRGRSRDNVGDGSDHGHQLHDQPSLYRRRGRPAKVKRERSGGSRHANPTLLHNVLWHLSRQHHPGHLHRPRLGSGHRSSEEIVGVFESHRYMNLEATRFSHRDSEAHTSCTTRLLSESCHELLGGCESGVRQIREWLGTVRNDRFNFWVSRHDKESRQRAILEEVIAIRDQLQGALDRFKMTDRHRVLEPYKAMFQPHSPADEHDTPSHRHLFHCYVYQYHLTQMACNIITMLEAIVRLEQERSRPKLWAPLHRWAHLPTWRSGDITESTGREDDEDPNTIQGVGPTSDLNLPRRRDPDALPPQNKFELVLRFIFYGIIGLGRGNCLFALKTGCLTIILCLPSFLKSSAHFAYVNRFVWGIFMGQLTIARFRGDTAFGLVIRIFATFFGGAVGLAVWYIACGSGKEDTFAYALAAVCAVCFPFFFYAILYWPVHPMTNIIFFVTAILVVGYSYQDFQLVIPGSPGSGWEVAWRRFILVTVGVTAAFIFSFLPPSATIRCYQRHILATTCSEIGTLYCSVISFANSQKKDEDIQEIVTSLIAIRSKLKRSEALRANIVYEFSFRGRWPMMRYKKIQELQMQIAYLLSDLLSVVEHMEPSWTRAFLKRSRCINTDFQGDALAVINMVASSLRTGDPLPQITPCPLLDRLMLQYQGLDVIHRGAEEDYGLPRVLTLETLMNEQYLMFCVGISTVYALMIRLDKLMMATKEVVGEQYHIHGLGFLHLGVEHGPWPSSMPYVPSKEV